MEAAADGLVENLLAVMEKGFEPPLPEREFGRLALRVFAHQFERNEPYASYCRRRGKTPATVSGWREIPAVPTAAFKEVPLVAGDPGRVEALFRTSGTTRGPERRGAHHILDLSLYHASLLAAFDAFVLPDGARLRLHSLLPPASTVPDSSLAHMLTLLVERRGAGGSGHFADASGLAIPALEASLREAESAGLPVAILGTSFSFVHWLDDMERRGAGLRLAPGSRLMDTGGPKGHGRSVEPRVLRRLYAERLAIPPDHAVNEYGMTELCSQLYDDVLRASVRGERPAPRADDRPPDPDPGGPRVKRGPPWLRTVVVDPETLEPLPPGEVGILRHVDLANVGSVVAVQTEDIGRTVAGGIELLGRAAEAPPRGCSIAADLFLESVRER